LLGCGTHFTSSSATLQWELKVLLLGSYQGRILFLRMMSNLNINFKSLAFRYVFQSVLFYIAILSIVFIAERLEPSGPCTPSLGILLLLFFPLAMIFLVILNAIKFFTGKKANLYPLFLHIIMLICWFIFLW
jgi:hypothetical protein